MSFLWPGLASWPRGCLGFIPVDVVTALTDDSQQPQTCCTLCLLLFLGKTSESEVAGCWDNGIIIYFRNRNKHTERA